jgi:hypothetical protein
MYRREVHRIVKFGAAGAFAALQAEKNKLLVEAGCTPYKVWCPAFGELGHLVLEASFPTMEAFEVEGKVIGGLERIGAIDAQLTELVLPGTDTAFDKLSKVVLDTEDAA